MDRPRVDDRIRKEEGSKRNENQNEREGWLPDRQRTRLASGAVQEQVPKQGAQP